MPNNLRQKTAGYENQLSATAEIINTSSAKGTATLTSGPTRNINKKIE